MQVTWTESAANQAKEILSGEEPGLNVRCFIQGGGCSGFQYGFTLDKQNDEDWVFETNGSKLLIDPLSGAYFDGATIDYKDDPLNGSSFIISNPNAKATCGCGSSAAFQGLTKHVWVYYNIEKILGVYYGLKQRW